MLNYYHLLCIHPTASRSDIQAALDKQQSLGKLPPATLKLAADTLLSPENRQVYDAQLSALPEMNQSYAMAAEDLATANGPMVTKQPLNLVDNAEIHAESQADNIVIYHNIRRPETNSRRFSMVKIKHTIMTSPIIWLLIAVLVFKLIAMATQKSDFDVAEQHCIAAIQQQLTYPNSLHIFAEDDVKRPWKHRRTEYPVTIQYAAQQTFNDTQRYRAECVYNSESQRLTDVRIAPM